MQLKHVVLLFLLIAAPTASHATEDACDEVTALLYANQTSQLLSQVRVAGGAYADEARAILGSGAPGSRFADQFRRELNGFIRAHSERANSIERLGADTFETCPPSYGNAFARRLAETRALLVTLSEIDGRLREFCGFDEIQDAIASGRAFRLRAQLAFALSARTQYQNCLALRSDQDCRIQIRQYTGSGATSARQRLADRIQLIDEAYRRHDTLAPQALLPVYEEQVPAPAETATPSARQRRR